MTFFNYHSFIMNTLTLNKAQSNKIWTQNPLLLGVFTAVLSNVLFGVLYAYGKWLAPLSGTGVFLWRMLMMWVCLVLFLLISGKFHQVTSELRTLKRSSWLWLLLPTPIFASQLWLFMYAPLHGLGVQVSMGYFLFPLMMVVVGYLSGEKLSTLQKSAVVLAAIGVTVEFIRLGEIGVASLWVCLTYPIYYVLRKKQGISALTGLFVDVTLIAPVCLWWLITKDGTTLWTVLDSGTLLIKVAGLGMVSILALQSSLHANRLLPSSLFGMLSYLEPALLFVIAITFLGDVFHWSMLGSFGLIWLAIGCLVLQGVKGLKTKQR